MMYMDPGELVAVLGTFTIVGAVFYPIARALAKRIEGKPQAAQIAPATDSRLDRIEHAVEAIAVEVERISEGQRFTTKLLSERSQGDTPRSAAERNR